MAPDEPSRESWDAAYTHVRLGPRKEFGPGEDVAIRNLRQRVPLGPGTSVVELGGGGGSFLLAFAELGCECYAIDFSEVGLAEARKLFEHEGLALETIQADLFDLAPNLRGRFDVAVSYGLCEHFQDFERDTIFRAHRDLLRPGGATLISVPNRLSPLYQLWWAATRVIAGLGLARRFDVNIINEWAFTRRELIKRCETAGLHDIAVVGTPLLGDLVDMFLRPTHKFLRRLVGRPHHRQPRLHAFRLPLDDHLGAYVYAVATARD